jgi:hypothetical protein
MTMEEIVADVVRSMAGATKVLAKLSRAIVAPEMALVGVVENVLMMGRRPEFRSSAQIAILY